MREIVDRLPQYDYIYLGDNARTPYGNRSFETVYKYTLQAVKWLFNNGCYLIIIACNTASAKALRSIQQIDLPRISTQKRVLGVIRPVTEIAGTFSRSKHIGLFATSGTVISNTYQIEIAKSFPDIILTQQACPMLVPLIENDEFDNSGADYFISKYSSSLLEKDPLIDTVILGCTHYPIIFEKIKENLSEEIMIINQGNIVAKSLDDYLQRHPEIEQNLKKDSGRQFFTTDNPEIFDKLALLFYGDHAKSERVFIE